MSESMSASAPAAEVAAPIAAEAAPVVEASEDLGQEDIALLEAEETAEASSAAPAKASTDQKEVQKEVNKQIEKWILKGNKGEDIEVSDINELVKRAQKGLGAELKFQEAADIKKEAAELIEMLTKDPLGLLEELGLDTVTLAQQKLAKKLEEDSKSPEQKQREMELKELEELRNHKKTLEQEKKQMDYQRIVAEEERKLEEGMVGALSKEGLPVKPAYIKRMAEIMQAGLEQGVDLTPHEALTFARKEVVSDLRELLDVAPDDMLEDLIGSNNAKRMRKRYLSRAKEKAVVTPSQIQSIGKDAQSIEAKSNKPKLSIKDWMKGNGSI